MELAFSASCTFNVTVYLTVMYILSKLDLTKRISQCVKKLLDEITTKIENYAKIKQEQSYTQDHKYLNIVTLGHVTISYLLHNVMHNKSTLKWKKNKYMYKAVK